MLAALALGLPAYVLIKVLHPSYFAREDTRTPMIYTGVSMVANAMLSFILFVLIGATGIAIAATLSGWLKVTLLAHTLRQRGEFVLDGAFRRSFLGIVLASLTMGAVVWAVSAWLEPWFDPARGIIVQGAALVVLVVSGLATYTGAAELLGAVKLKAFFKGLTGR
jgi:putative peptidoglycan lipid II flippase